MSTYNPIIECVELRRVRVGSPLKAPANGTALVLERAVGEPLVVHHGDRVPEARLGNYRRMHVVDVATRGIGFSTSAPSSDHTFPFTVTVRFACQVTNPVAIARNDVTDMTAALSPSLTGIVREIAAKYDVLHPAKAEAEMRARLNSAYTTIDVELTGFSVFVSAQDTAELISTIREHRVEDLARDHHREIADGGRDALILHSLARGADGLDILDRHRKDAAIEMEMKLEALRALTGDTKDVADKTDIHRTMLSEFFPGEDSPAKTRTSMRERLENRAKPALNSGKVVEGAAPATPATSESGSGNRSKDPAAPTSNGEAPATKRSSRVRGSMGSQPSSDEG
jgi:hypothetical protein